MSLHLQTKAHSWLTKLSRSRKTISLFIRDYEELRKLVPIDYERVIRNRYGEARLIVIDTEKAISLIKEKFQFFTKSEIEKELKSGFNL